MVEEAHPVTRGRFAMVHRSQGKKDSSLDRLRKLINERLAEGADRAAIDVRIWELFGEEWAVMFTDLSGFSRSVAKFGIIHFLQVIFESERIFSPLIDQHDGLLLKTDGDSMLVIFRKPEKAAQCAIQMNRALVSYNQGKTDEDQILLCLGLGFGRLLRIGDHDVFGAEVNAASKLGEDTAKVHEILVTEAFQQALAPSGHFRFEPIDTVPPGSKAAFRMQY